MSFQTQKLNQVKEMDVYSFYYIDDSLGNQVILDYNF